MVSHRYVDEVSVIPIDISNISKRTSSCSSCAIKTTPYLGCLINILMRYGIGIRIVYCYIKSNSSGSIGTNNRSIYRTSRHRWKTWIVIMTYDIIVLKIPRSQFSRACRLNLAWQRLRLESQLIIALFIRLQEYKKSCRTKRRSS